MDDSQSSDFLSNSSDYSCKTPENVNAVPYHTLILKTKNSINESLHGGTTKFSLSQFTSLMADCSSCILQSLDLIIGLLVDTDVHYQTLTEYMEHAVCLLQLLSNYINTAIESVTMSCCTMKMFPATTGNLVLAVFTHCKDSETMYGSHLKYVQRQLKDLFRTCHELQLTYLMVLEKHFIFDLSEKEEQDILIKALDINLAIGEIVQTLDVKTMAEQWKAYTMICEKHASFLSDKEVFQDCSEILCKMTTNNITTALEANQEDKIVLRSLKVASFTIKILLKLYKTFQSASGKNYINVLEFMVFINKCNPSYLVLELRKSNNFIKQITATVFTASDLLLAELVSDEAFLQRCLLYSAETSRNKNERLGFIVLIASVIEKILNKSDHIECRHKIIKCIFNMLPKCHIWFSFGLKFMSNSYHKSCGLYEHILIHSIALATTLSSEEYSLLEQDLFEALLGTDFWSALFASDLWVAVSRNNRQLHIEQFVFLCKTYQKLENNKLFHDSPQQVHLSYTIARLFEAMKTEDKIRLYSKILALWSPLQIENIPPEVREKAIEDTHDSLLVKFDKVLSSGIESEEEIRQMSKLMKAAATCRLVDIDELEDCLTKVWIKSCPKNRIILSLGKMDKGSLWYLDYIEALVTLTNSIKRLLDDSGAVAKILHVIANIAQLGSTELNIVILDLLCQLSLQILNENMNQLESLITQTYKTILQKNDRVISSTLCKKLKNYANHKNFEYLLSIVFSLDISLQDAYSYYNQDVGHADMKRWGDDFISEDHVYAHKCVENAPVIERSISGSSREFKENSNNFDFADIDSLFGGESDSEPASKKAKFTNMGRNEEIIARLEKDSLLLCSEKENFFCDNDISRIKAVCERLKNIID